MQGVTRTSRPSEYVVSRAHILNELSALQFARSLVATEARRLHGDLKRRIEVSLNLLGELRNIFLETKRSVQKDGINGVEPSK